MLSDIFSGILLPFIGTTAGAACVLLMKSSFGKNVERVLLGSAAGIMTAASVWSLLIPAIDQCREGMGSLAFVPAAVGFALGIAFLMLLDRIIPEHTAEGDTGNLSDRRLMILAVTIHNIPEGMAVGVVYAGLIYGSSEITAAGAMALALGIAIQNFPEGAIISMPLHTSGMGKFKAFLYGTLSGAVEPAGALLTVAAAGLIVPAMPYLLSFAAGAMIYVVADELIPEMGKSATGIASFSAGFLLMMALDVAL